MTLSPTFIEAEYRRLGHTQGWRFLTCPEGNIDSASVALVTINPGGGTFEPPRWSVEAGSAYEIESWKGYAPGQENLQRQIRRMFQVMDVSPHKALTGYFVPFRSRNWEELPLKADSISFGIRLWQEVFERARIRTVIAFGKEIAPYMITILDARCVARRPAGWGTETIDEYRFDTDGRLHVLPHLSRFGLFGRPQSESAFRSALEQGSTPALAEISALRATNYRTANVIRVLVPNPKRGKSRLRFDCYRDGMTVEEYEKEVRERLGADEAKKCGPDLKWDTDPKRQFIRIERG